MVSVVSITFSLVWSDIWYLFLHWGFLMNFFLSCNLEIYQISTTHNISLELRFFFIWETCHMFSLSSICSTFSQKNAQKIEYFFHSFGSRWFLVFFLDCTEKLLFCHYCKGKTSEEREKKALDQQNKTTKEEKALRALLVFRIWHSSFFKKI